MLFGSCLDVFSLMTHHAVVRYGTLCTSHNLMSLADTFSQVTQYLTSLADVKTLLDLHVAQQLSSMLW